MNHLIKISQFLYFQLIAVFVLVIYLQNSYGGADGNNFIYVYFTLLIIPVIDFLLTGIFSGLKLSELMSKKNSIGLITYIGINILLLILGYFTLPLFLFLSLVYTIIYKIDGRIYFLGALLVFLYVMLGLILGDSAIAEGLSVLAYYLLIAGVIAQICENISFFQPSSHA